MLAVKLNYYLRRAFAGHRDILSGDGEVLCEGSTSVGERAIYLDGQFDKVIGMLPGLTRERAYSSIEGGIREHQPTLLFDVGQAVLLDGTIFKDGRKRSILQIDPVQKEVLRLGTVCLASSWVGSRFFGHWLSDDCTAYELAEQFGTPLCIRTPPWPDKPYYGELFGQDWTPVDRARIDRLLVLSAFAQNDLKLETYAKLRERVRSQISVPERDGIVYVKRGRSGAMRSMDNEDAVVELLASQGVSICEMEKSPLLDTLKLLLGAKLVIVVEGSDLGHAIYTLRQGAGVLAIYPPYFFNPYPRFWTERLGISFGFVVGDPTDTGYNLNPDELMATIELMLKHVR